MVTGYEAASFTVNGLHGALLLIAVLLFLVAAVIGWFLPGHKAWQMLVAAGLCLATLSALVSGLTSRFSLRDGDLRTV